MRKEANEQRLFTNFIFPMKQKPKELGILSDYSEWCNRRTDDPLVQIE